MSAPVVWVALHDLSRTGVPVVLERYLSVSSSERRRRVHVVARRDGPLRDSIARLAGSLHVFEPESGRSAAGTVTAGARQLGASSFADAAERLRWRAWRRSLPAPDVLVVHGAGAWEAIRAVDDHVPVVLHLHELEVAFGRCVPPSARAGLIERIDLLMAVSRPVAEFAERLGVPASSIVDMPGVVAPGPNRAVAPATPQRSGGGVWVMGAGRPGWRKGTDRLAAIAHELVRRGSPATLGWVGGRPAGHDAQWVESTDPVRWFPECDDPWAVLGGAGALVVPSREDPLPLVALEAGRHGVPVVAMPTGGLVDLLADGRGLVAEREELSELCDLVEQVVGSPELAGSLAGSLAEHVERHHRPEVVGPSWWATLEQAAVGGPGCSSGRGGQA